MCSGSCDCRSMRRVRLSVCSALLNGDLRAAVAAAIAPRSPQSVLETGSCNFAYVCARSVKISCAVHIELVQVATESVLSGWRRRLLFPRFRLW